MWLKIIGSIMIIASSIAAGLLAGKELTRRLEELRLLRMAVFLLRGEICYGNAELPEAICSVARRHDGSIAEFMKSVSRRLSEHNGENLNEIWKQSVAEDTKGMALTKKDKELLYELGSRIGMSVKEQQLGSLDNYIQNLDMLIAHIAADIHEKVKLYRSLGILAGCMMLTLIL